MYQSRYNLSFLTCVFLIFSSFLAGYAIKSIFHQVSEKYSIAYEYSEKNTCDTKLFANIEEQNISADTISLCSLYSQQRLQELQSWEKLLYFPRTANISGIPPLYFNDYQDDLTKILKPLERSIDQSNENTHITAVTFEFRANYGQLIMICPKI
jgi:hypothetical protein